VVTELLDRARAGDEEAFAQLTAPYRGELHVHCYRILGSVHDAEDAMQETMLAAWRSLARFEGRASIRTWLYRIATNRCLNVLRSASRRPQQDPPFAGLGAPQPNQTGEVVWLEPYPDVLLEGLADPMPGPEARYETREAISLAFVTALQLLPPRQRAALVLRDVLGFRASEAAHILDTTQESVSSALKRARAALDRQPASGEVPPRAGSPEEQRLVERMVRAFQANDLDGLIALLSDDVCLRMPPIPLEYSGRDLAREFFAVVAFRPGRTFRLVATRANQQPAFGVYVADLHTPAFHASGLLVLTLAGERICGITRFDNSALPHFGLPRTLTGSGLPSGDQAPVLSSQPMMPSTLDTAPLTRSNFSAMAGSVPGLSAR
jgi:RNA polymerase sigma-70 factor (TIGR02960 family)